MKAIALMSGGLDSTLAAALVSRLGIELIAFNAGGPFCLCTKKTKTGCVHSAVTVAGALGLKIIQVNTAAEFLEIVKNPKHGYGSHMNPCIDCRILLFRKAKEVMASEGASFIITGEVLGQRPMSQRLAAMKLIDKEANLEGLVVRPLSAQVLDETIPEKMKWIRREDLLAIQGRSRKEQFVLAQSFNIVDYPCPAGGCLLTDPSFSVRVKDCLLYGELSLDNLPLLKTGRHFRLSNKAKLVVGRNETENTRLENLANDSDLLFISEDVPGPVGLVRGNFNSADYNEAASIIASYCDVEKGEDVTILLKRHRETNIIACVSPGRIYRPL